MLLATGWREGAGHTDSEVDVVGLLALGVVGEVPAQVDDLLEGLDVAAGAGAVEGGLAVEVLVDLDRIAHSQGEQDIHRRHAR